MRPLHWRPSIELSSGFYKASGRDDASGIAILGQFIREIPYSQFSRFKTNMYQIAFINNPRHNPLLKNTH